MKNMVVKLGVFLVITALARAAATEGERSTGHVLDPKENAIHNADFSEMSEEVMDFDYWNLTSYQDIGARNGFCDLEGYNPCDSDSEIYHKHPSKCEYFIQCSNNIPNCIKCPVNQHWSESINNCILKENSDCTECECGEINKRRIIGGSVVSPGRKYPWMVGLRIPAKSGQPINPYSCGGSIINDRYILTAAHCVVDDQSCNKLNSNAMKLEVWVGDHIQDDGSDDLQGITMKFGITNIVPHCDYNCRTFVFDIALIELDKKIVFDDIIKPICLPKDDKDDYIGETGISTGWGRINNPPCTPCSYASSLNEVNLKIRANDDCGLWWSDSTYCSNKGITPILPSVNLCAGSLAPGDGVCWGDSGGPLFVFKKNKHVLVGITSYGGDNHCLDPNYPAVFTRVSTVLGWIDSITKNAKKCN